MLVPTATQADVSSLTFGQRLHRYLMKSVLQHDQTTDLPKLREGDGGARELTDRPALASSSAGRGASAQQKDPPHESPLRRRSAEPRGEPSGTAAPLPARNRAGPGRTGAWRGLLPWVGYPHLYRSYPAARGEPLEGVEAFSDSFVKRRRAVASPGTEPFCLLLGDGCRTASEEGMAEQGQEGERERDRCCEGEEGKARENRHGPLKAEAEGEAAPSPAALRASPPLAGENGLARLLLSAQRPGPSVRPPRPPSSCPVAPGGPRRSRCPVAPPARGRAAPGGRAPRQSRAAVRRGSVRSLRSPRRLLTAPAGPPELPEAPAQHYAAAVWAACRRQAARAPSRCPAVTGLRGAGGGRRRPLLSYPAVPAMRGGAAPPPAARRRGTRLWRCRGAAAGPRGVRSVAGGRDCCCTAGGGRSQSPGSPEPPQPGARGCPRRVWTSRCRRGPLTRVAWRQPCRGPPASSLHPPSGAVRQ